jgi:hypothetical protein
MMVLVQYHLCTAPFIRIHCKLGIKILVKGMVSIDLLTPPTKRSPIVLSYEVLLIEACLLVMV